MPFSVVLNNILIPILYLRHHLHLKNMRPDPSSLTQTSVSMGSFGCCIWACYLFGLRQCPLSKNLLKVGWEPLSAICPVVAYSLIASQGRPQIVAKLVLERRGAWG